MPGWNAKQYKKYEKERTQPVIDLIGRTETSPKTVLDIGCGPGNSTKKLSDAFPAAEILGIDSSEDMLCSARKNHPELAFRLCRVPEGLEELGNFDLIFSNACLHWVPDHKALFPKIMEKLNGGGMLAVQMPLVGNAPFYRALGELLKDGKWQKLKSVNNFHNLSPDDTYDILCGVSGRVTMWETVYYHIVPSRQAVVEWYKGSGLRPYLERLGDGEREAFISALLDKINDIFPVKADGNVILKMPRLFFTAEK